MARKESQFLTELRKSFEAEGVFFHKITDLPQSYLAGRMRFDKPKPFDAFLSVWGRAVAIEAKVIPKYQAFGRRALRESQLKGLQAVEDSAGSSYVFLNVRGNGRGRLNRLIIFKWDDLRGTPLSLKKKEIEALPYIENKKGLFDVSEFVGQFI